VPDLPIRADKVDAIDRQMRKLIEDAERAVAGQGGDLNDFARHILAGRKQRDRYFDPVLFSNPAWDILLNLFVADGEGRTATLLESCLASTVPQGVALRWLRYLKQEEMVLEISDPRHPRQTLIRLSDQARRAIAAYLGSLVSLGLGPEPVMPGIPRSRD
jgi:hypothetical protein